MPISGSTQMTLYFGTLTMSTYADDVDNDDDDDTNSRYNIEKNTEKSVCGGWSEIFYNENWIRKVVEWTTRRKSSRAENEIKLYFFCLYLTFLVPSPTPRPSIDIMEIQRHF